MVWRKHWPTALVGIALLTLAATSGAQEPPAPANAADQEPVAPTRAPPSPSLSDQPRTFTASGQRFRVVPIKGFSYPWAIAFLPDGSMLVSERGVSTLRIVRNGVLDPKPITGLPQMIKPAGSRAGVDLALHPKYAENKLIYFTYWKPRPKDEDVGTAVLARARYDGGTALTDVVDLFQAEAWSDGPAAARITFGPDGKIYMIIGAPGFTKRVGNASSGQNPGEHGGKVLRLNEDGSAPTDNPFIGRPGYKPEIYVMGIRNSNGITINPANGEIWATDNGPQGGDEINIIKRGLNYGWPVVTYGRAYNYDLKGERSGLPPPTVKPPTSAPGMEEPFMYYSPSISAAGIAFYTGDKFPLWKGNVFVTGLVGRQVSRITLSRIGLESRREILLAELRQRIRDVKQGPDGLLYMTTDEKDGTVLRIEPVAEAEQASSK